MPVFVGVWKMAVRTGAISVAQSFSTLFGMYHLVQVPSMDSHQFLSSFSRTLVVICSLGIVHVLPMLF